ncbi:hypothetical protein [Methylorubrum thiocyanatum]|uniref:Uncharacterized protein n=1 Tax=Methylorubrum thiocyanatum TaxID=47958 RepID=A0AA40S0L8_9HYPH|nr:hypothetical protein [Methylorubrum thiocyanatum]MBA8912273.1 hypothetical protein [Methylorubrum thiocyanatum]GJE81067.1 hypothetical protein CJNNKLLH_2409 [Methylorubrum thiocyanatum]
MFNEHSLDAVADIVKNVVARKCNDFRDGDIVDEDDFSSALVSSLRDGLNDLKLQHEASYITGYGATSSREYTVHARATKSRHAASEENYSGADILMGFRAEIDGEPIRKAALIQAKLYDGEGQFLKMPSGTKDKEYLLKQCRRMRRIAGDASYVVIYSKVGIRFYSGTEYIANFPIDLNFESGKSFEEFVRGIFSCAIGNRDLDYMPRGGFSRYLDALGIRNGFEAELD